MNKPLIDYLNHQLGSESVRVIHDALELFPEEDRRVIIAHTVFVLLDVVYQLIILTAPKNEDPEKIFHLLIDKVMDAYSPDLLKDIKFRIEQLREAPQRRTR